uniref:Uncharacterized protein n=1 Tax=Geladintestivirus 1 TaxID=3233133 RepID=A0AAU8MK80_9CAUD
MGKIIIVEEKAEKMYNKLDKVKHCIEEIMSTFSDCMTTHAKEEDDDEDWDDEYEIKRRRAAHRGYRSDMRNSRY